MSQNTPSMPIRYARKRIILIMECLLGRYAGGSMGAFAISMYFV